MTVQQVPTLQIAPPVAGAPIQPPIKRQKAQSLFDRTILRRALVDSFFKLAPRRMMKNPVMFLVEVGALLTTLLLVWDRLSSLPPRTGWKAVLHETLFQAQITLWLWATVLFANFAEAVAEGRGKAQADALRKAKSDTVARKLTVWDRLSSLSSEVHAGEPAGQGDRLESLSYTRGLESRPTRSRRRLFARATSSSWKRTRSSPATGRSPRESHRSTSRRSPENRRR